MGSWAPSPSGRADCTKSAPGSKPLLERLPRWLAGRGFESGTAILAVGMGSMPMLRVRASSLAQ